MNQQLPARTNHNLFYDNLPVRMIQREDGQLWFVARDVCDILELDHITNALKGLDEDELTVEKLQSGGQDREMKLISESGLYTLVIRSNKPQAKPFRRWVTHEVLPSIRKHGYYGEPPETVNQSVVDRLARVEEAVQHMQLRHHRAGSVIWFVHYCCQTGYQRHMVSKQQLHSAYIEYCAASGVRPECLAHFCMKLYGSIDTAGKAQMTIAGKRTAAVRGVSLLQNYRHIISDIRKKHQEQQEQELSRRRQYYFGIEPKQEGQLSLFDGSKKLGEA